jgi:hypothetical protein
MRQRMHQTTIVSWRQSGLIILAGLALSAMILTAMPAPALAGSTVAEISLNQTQFTPTSEVIKGVAKVAGAVKGQKLTADLFYVTENLKALSVTKDVPGDGEISFDFSFSKPTNNWPKGDYQVVISTSDGAVKEVAFQVK